MEGGRSTARTSAAATRSPSPFLLWWVCFLFLSWNLAMLSFVHFPWAGKQRNTMPASRRVRPRISKFLVSWSMQASWLAVHAWTEGGMDGFTPIGMVGVFAFCLSELGDGLPRLRTGPYRLPVWHLPVVQRCLRLTWPVTDFVPTWLHRRTDEARERSVDRWLSTPIDAMKAFTFSCFPHTFFLPLILELTHVYILASAISYPQASSCACMT